MHVRETPLPGVLVIEPKIYQDERGLFLESYQAERYREAGLEATFVQDNLSRSTKGVLRGLHYQSQHPQGKLVSVALGAVFDVCVDLRRGLPTFGQWFGQVLSDQNHWQMYIPPGCAHGFCVTSEIAVVTYKCTDFYVPEDEYSLHWNDPTVRIKWPIASPIVSQKDAAAPLWADVHLPHIEQEQQGE
jgi:dTDP-4-dehydrorhamnose 3,5-epimerase